MIIESEKQLRELYGQPKDRAVKKLLTTLDKHAINFISKSPFLVISSYDAQGNMDVSPKGGSPGFVEVLNDKQILIPDSKGNNRIDSLVNIVETGRIGMLFLIPGVDETLRINGSAKITADTETLERYAEMQNPPKTCLIITVEEAFLHCAKALMRSKLWSADAQIERSEFPTMGTMLKDQIGASGVPESQEEMVKRYQPDL